MKRLASKVAVGFLVLVVGLAVIAWLLLPRTPQGNSMLWAGIDVSVIGKLAADAGREVKEPFINMTGDLGLFLFALGGAIGGFVAGYYWRRLVSEKTRSK
ncbi:MAG: hypothetical protein Q7R57_07325 [Dehalococcoidales bacterium]|nr:hypothetical protein [Dehalococcoidales bacterium]